MYSIGAEIGVDPKVILQTSHGRRSIDMLKVLAPEKANWECERHIFFSSPSLPFSRPFPLCPRTQPIPTPPPSPPFGEDGFAVTNQPPYIGAWRTYSHTECTDIRHMEGLLPKLHGEDAVEIPGARALLDSLVAARTPWAIVTSGTEPLVNGWLEVLKLPHPDHLVTAESVENGKPDPACYNLGKKRLGLGVNDDNSSSPGDDVVVFEDSPAGILSGKAAGCKVIGLVTSHALDRVLAAEPDWIVEDLRSVEVVECAGGVVTLQISNALTQ